MVSTKYLCQVPKRKPIGEIFISVLLPDLVLLQAAWKLYTFLVEQILLRKRDGTRVCEGCVNNELARHELKNGAVISCASTLRPEDGEGSFGGVFFDNGMKECSHVDLHKFNLMRSLTGDASLSGARSDDNQNLRIHRYWCALSSVTFT